MSDRASYNVIRSFSDFPLSRRRLLTLTGVGLVGLACNPTPSSSSSSVEVTKSTPVLRPLRAALAGIPLIDPHYGSGGSYHLPAIWDTLMRLGADGNLIPGLATSWKLIDPTTLELKLRNDVSFHNDEKLTSKTVKWNIDRLIGLKTIDATRIRSIASVETPDEYTVRIKTSEPDPLLERMLPLVFMLPSETFERVGEKAFFQSPIASGPYRLEKFVQNEQALMIAEPKAWRKPTFSQIDFRAITESSSRANGVESGALDFIRDVSASEAASLKAAGYTVVSGVQASTQVVQFYTTRGGPLADKRVRQALNYAVDKETYVKKVMEGYGEVVEGQLAGKPAFGYNPNIKAYPYDVAKAKALLAAAGFPNGFEEKLAFTPTQDPSAGPEAVGDFFRAVGVNVKITAGDATAFRASRQAGTLDSMYVARWNYYPGLDADVSVSWFDSSSTGFKPAYVNPAFDALFRPSRSEMDRNKREKMLQDAQAFLYEEAPCVFLARESKIFVHNKNIVGFQPRADAAIYFDELSWSS